MNTIFKIRKTKPSGWFYNNKDKKGGNPYIDGYPPDSDANVLANCTGYAMGRFNEISSELIGIKKFHHVWFGNAEDWYKRAAANGLETGQTPEEGAIGVFTQAGSGFGHVFIVEEVKENGDVYTSESGWNSLPFWNRVRQAPDYGYRSMKFRGFIYNPEVRRIKKMLPEKTVRNENQDQVKVNIGNLRLRKAPNTLTQSATGLFIDKGLYDIEEIIEASPATSNYKWFKLKGNVYIAYINEEETAFFPKKDIRKEMQMLTDDIKAIKNELKDLAQKILTQEEYQKMNTTKDKAIKEIIANIEKIL